MSMTTTTYSDFDLSTATDLIGWMRGGVLRHGAWRVRRYVFDDSPQPVDDVIVVDLIPRHP
jgi:hypothetical protein